VETMGQLGVQEGGEKRGLEATHGLPNQVRDVVGARGGGICGLGKGSGYFLKGEGSLVLVVCEAEERGRWGFRGEKSGEGASLLPRLGQRPLANQGIFVAGDET